MTKLPSTSAKHRTRAVAATRFQFSTFVITTKYASDVHSMVNATASPYADARRSLERKPMTSTAQPIASAKFTDGTNTWPL